MRSKAVLVLGLVVVLLGTAILTDVFARGARLEPMQELARMRPQREFAPRLSIQTRYRACTAHAPDPADTVATIPTETCGARDEGTSDEGSLPLRALADAWESTDPDSLQASALAAIIWRDESNEQALDRAIVSLEKALRLSTRRIPLLVDLSAVHLMRAEWTQNQHDLVVALDRAEEALALEPGNALARFNSALAMQAFGLDERADSAWAAYLAIDRTSPWADEARRRRGLLITQVAEIPNPLPGASAEQVTEFAREFPQAAREYGWSGVLGRWGAATVRGDTTSAASWLNLADWLGDALQTRDGGDHSLTDAVVAIRAARSDAAITALARGHQAYATAQVHFQELEDSAAAEALDRVVRSQAASPVLMQWTALYQAGARRYSRKPGNPVADLRSLLAQVDSSRHTALAGRARMMLAAMLLHDSRLLEAREQYARAAEYFRRAGEAENWGAVLSGDGEAAYEDGDTLQAYRSLHRAQQALRPYQRSARLHNHLHGLARCASLDGLSHAALVIRDEDVQVARRVGTPLRVLDALQARARARIAVGDPEGAARDVESAYVLATHLPEEKAQQEWALSAIRTARPATVSPAAMDSAVDVFAAHAMWRVDALLWRADARLRTADLSGAINDLKRVTDGVRGLSSRPGDALLRSAVLEQARSRFDQLVMLNLRLGRPADALRELERGRLSFARQREGESPNGEIPLSAPPGHVALDYALIGDTLLTWTIRGDTIRILGQALDRDEFMLTVDQVNAALESPLRAEGAAPGLRRLYDWLIRPVRGYLGPRTTPLVIVADGEVAGVPFAAMLDSSRERYLVEDYPLRFAATLADAARPGRSGSRTGPALLVADPAFDEGEYSRLYRLLGAREEVDSVGRLYPHSVLLEGRTATREAFVARAQSASLIHYAGHAVFDDARPERSHLVLAGADTTGRLTAEAVSTMRLDGVRLVVLSACRTLPSREGRSGGFGGLSGALLTAGAGGVVGTLWQVNDELTAPLMREFHREYRDSSDPAHALRTAQLRMMASADSSLSSPAAWAGFRYTGDGRPSSPAVQETKPGSARRDGG